MITRESYISQIIDLLYKLLEKEPSAFHLYSSFFKKDYTSTDKNIFGYVVFFTNHDVNIIISRYTNRNTYDMKFCVFLENDEEDFVDYLGELNSRTAFKFFQTKELEELSSNDFERVKNELELRTFKEK